MRRYFIPVLGMLVLIMSTAVPAANAASNPPWYAQRLESLGFYVFDPPFTFQDFRVSTPAGETKTRASSKGNVVLLNFWATWCPPCKEEMPGIEALSKTMKGKAFEVFAVNLGDSAEAVKSFMAEQKLSFPVYLDQKHLLSQTYASQGIPTTYILDRQGKFIAGMVGSYDYSRPELVAFLTELAAK